MFHASDQAKDGKRHLLLGASGSVATIKLPLILQALASRSDLAIRVILTASASKFLQGQSAEQPELEQLGKQHNIEAIYHDEDEWFEPWERGSPILHIELRRWADLFVIAPLSANTLAKLSNGLADNLLLSVARAWDSSGTIEGHRKMILVAPAMNTAMWQHPLTSKQIGVLKEWSIEDSDNGWIKILPPAEKMLACGDAGVGAMIDWTKIVEEIDLNTRALK